MYNVILIGGGRMQMDVITSAASVIKEINKELRANNISSVEYLLLRVSSVLSRDLSIKKEDLSLATMEEVDKILVANSYTYDFMYKNDEYSKPFVFIHKYMELLLKKYDSMLLKEGTQFDRYVEIAAGKMPSKEVYDAENLRMDMGNVENTLALLNEAVRLYFELYDKKKLSVLFSDEQEINFKIKEKELAHILGINIKKIVNDPKLVDLLGITSKEKEAINDTSHTIDPNGLAAISILSKIVEMNNGNLLEYEEDRLRKMLGYTTYNLVDNNILYDEKGKETLPYSKINMRSKAFIDFKPLEELTMALNFPEGYKIIKTSKQDDSQHSLLISKNNLSRQYKYSTLVANYDKNGDRRYFQSLLVEKPENMEQWQKDASPAISTRVTLESDESSQSGSRLETIFTEEQQRKFFDEVYADFNKVNFEGIIEYFQNFAYGSGGKKRKPN